MIYKINTGSMYYTIYKITNLINNNIYIGYHKTDDINDDYMGSGKVLLQSIKKYGKENFKKEILYVFPNKKEALLKESELVNQEFIKRNDTYNIKVGGEGGWDYINNFLMKDDEFKQNISIKLSNSIKKLYEEGILNTSGINNPRYGKTPWNKGIPRSNETKKKISENNANKLSKSIINSRLEDLKDIKKTYGYISKLAKKWNVSHTQVRRFINKHYNSKC